MRLREQKDLWQLTLIDGRITRLQMDYRLGLDLTDAEGTASLYIETPCLFYEGSSSYDLIPADTGSLGPALLLFNEGVVAVEVKPQGLLTVFLTNTRRLEVPPDSKFESWQLSLPGRFLLVGSPGGYVSVFQEDNQAAPSQIQ
jgi:hypothetical protein